ncbi:hypothetical protein [Enterovibrio nigricans]|uniref:YvrJ protein family protein n=1 Tax=Enterovibrio nigricans DSM 22720 TaxID=1121868 RepID=A0A1T4V0U0_9GAMM|nr:hypothetical protein [Enterovibrio nigricans]SKA58590.1 hypothetical protein SAMN02745132_02994 [Enterovibrio nigricans DSM 22720]
MAELIQEMVNYGISPTFLAIALFLWRIEKRITIIETRVETLFDRVRRKISPHYDDND